MARKIELNWSKITEKVKEQESGGFKKEVDERFFKPKLDNSGNAELIIRFLWSKDTDVPFVKKYSHGFQGKTKAWYIEDCPTTIGKECPVCESNTEAWNNGEQDLARNRARRLSVYSNILIIKDMQTPENNGKIFLYRYGKKIHEMIMGKMSPDKNSVDESVMIHDPYKGANFKLKIKTVTVRGKKMPNYDTSEFTEVTKLGTDKEIEEIDNGLYELKGLISNDNFKPYDSLKQRFEKVIGVRTSKTNEEVIQDVNDNSEMAPGINEIDESVKEVNEELPTKKEQKPIDDIDDEEDDDDGFFASLADKE